MADESSAHETEAPPVSGLRQIVWLRQMLQRWQYNAAAAAARRSHDSASGDPDASADQQNEDTATAAATEDDDDDKKPPPLPSQAECADRRLRAVMVQERGGSSGSKEDNRPDDERGPGSEPMTPMTPDAPVDVPRGCCAVYVGAERRRFVVPTAYLGMPVFRRLLEKAEEEFGFDYRGGALTIPCETEAFKYILVVMDKHQKGLVDDEGNPTEAGESSENRD